MIAWMIDVLCHFKKAETTLSFTYMAQEIQNIVPKSSGNVSFKLLAFAYF